MAAANTQGPCICISFALPQEYAPFRRSAQFRSAMVRAGYSGAGVINSGRHAAALLDAAGPQPRALLICGFAGSLGDPGIGDVVIADRIIDCTGQGDTNREYGADSRLLATAESVRLPGIVCGSGALATTNRVLLNRGEKTAFLNRHGIQALGVDMETAGAVAVAEERGIPWLAVRTITDRVGDAMPFDFNVLTDSDGNVALGRVIAATLTHPWKIPALIQLGKRSALAANNLTGFLAALLPGISAT